jgi:Rad3-related DNA helicase
MDRGIDLPDDLCRVQVVAKIPYPNIKDRRINARMRSKGGSVWYRMQTIRSLVQMTGRGVRSETDRAVTYILDQQFGINLWRQGRFLFPSWWSEALNFRMTKRHLINTQENRVHG